MPRVSFRNLRRWTFATIAIASLVLCLATVGLWVRSYWRDDSVKRTSSYNGLATIYFTSTAGRLEIWNKSWPESADVILGPGRNWEYFEGRVWTPSRDGRLFGTFPEQRDEFNVAIYFPHWSLALLFAVVPTWWGMAIVRARRRPREGCCVNCGYDLRVQLALSEVAAATESNGRASPGRCPECGDGTILNADVASRSSK